MKATEFRARLQAAPRGQWVSYHIGLLMADTQRENSDKATELKAVRDAAWDAYEAGACLLVQRRFTPGPGKSEYFAVKL